MEHSIDSRFLNLFRTLIYSRLGIFISKKKDYLLRNKLQKILNKSKYKDIHNFYNSIKNNSKESFEELVRYTTTTHTYFFRENDHFGILKDDIIKKKITKPVIWCAACSTGEEVYSIIIELLENNINDFLIVATDINKDVLNSVKKGVYKEERLKFVNKNLLHKYFLKQGSKTSAGYSVKGNIKKFFILKTLNLIEPIKFEKTFNYIFCRNVLIYFPPETQEMVINNLLNNLDDSGYLFVGHSETLFRMNVNIESVSSSVYRKQKTGIKHG